MIKKFLPALVLISFLAVLAAPMIATAQGAPADCCKIKRAITIEGTACSAGAIVGPVVAETCELGAVSCGSTYWGMYCLLNTIYSVTDWIFVILVAAVALFVIMGAVSFLMSAGDPEKTKKGRDYILWAMVGLAVALLAKAIPGIARLVIGA